MKRIDEARPSPRLRRRTRGGTVAASLAPLLLTCCWSSTEHYECLPGQHQQCTTPCGEGQRSCDDDGTFGACVPTGDLACSPGEIGTCLLPDGDQGKWTCTQTCDIGPCEAGCERWQRRPCEGQCGPGEAPCGANGAWEPCAEHIAPACRPGEIQRCWEEPGHRRCRDDCTFGPCEEAPCVPGELAVCVTALCGLEVCQEDGSWSGCDMECIPGDSIACIWGRLTCSIACVYGECRPPDERPDFP